MRPDPYPVSVIRFHDHPEGTDESVLGPIGAEQMGSKQKFWITLKDPDGESGSLV